MRTAIVRIVALSSLGCSSTSGGNATPGDAGTADDAGRDARVEPGRDAATGDDAGADAGEPGTERLAIVADGTGIQRLEWDGVDLFEGVGGYYVIGSCTGADEPGNNVTSQGSDGRTLSAPGNCPGAPFSLTIEGLHPIRVTIEVGPLPADYRTLSVPLDPKKEYFTEFAFDGDHYEVGCALSWKERLGSGATFDSIPLPCLIPDLGGVGVARVRPPGAWGEIAGPRAVVRRTIVDGDAEELAFINHPGTNNIELGFNSDFSSVLPAGTVVRLVEEIDVRPAPSPATTLLPPLVRAILWREPSPAETDDLGPTIDRDGRDGMKQVARVLLATDEYAELRTAHTDDEILDQIYVGLLERNVDPSGHDTFLPLIAAGDEAGVVDSIVDSEEFGRLHPEAL